LAAINYFKSQKLIKFGEELGFHLLDTVLIADAAVPVLSFLKTLPVKLFTAKRVDGLGQLVVKVEVSDSHLIAYDPLPMLKARFNSSDHTMVQNVDL